MREMSQSCFYFEPMTLLVGPLSTGSYRIDSTKIRKRWGLSDLVNQPYIGKFLASHAGVLWASSRGPVFFFTFSLLVSISSISCKTSLV